MKYIKETPRISVKIYDSKTEELLITIKGRDWMNVGEIFPEHNISSIITEEFRNNKKLPPEKIMVMIAEEYTLYEN